MQGIEDDAVCVKMTGQNRRYNQPRRNKRGCSV